ncbi:MAG TPA: ATP synthase subunit I [Bryobacteraceae bacterium]|jgi:F1F0 ATPase subunit 2|nr:ATP synthase subunit I [Bryobacteraceae bacterium]
MSMVLAAVTGLTTGILFFGGLWATVRRLATARHPVILTLGSFWIRVVLAVAGFLLASRGDWRNAALCLAGFLAARFGVSRWVARCT